MDNLKELVYQAIGQASMCWDEIPKGIFDSTAASNVAETLCKQIEELHSNSPRKPLEVAEARRFLIEALKEDQGFYQAYKTNIAICFQDEYAKAMGSSGSKAIGAIDIPSIADKAAESFMQKWINS
ncbi:hypothetical protein M0R72_18070 [Candidatus Pacearchaeota archaeon]|jgi:hypothetical protein|nr:hypothetical protein [Candidatus Pacearchaeota archaeon]